MREEGQTLHHDDGSEAGLVALVGEYREAILGQVTAMPPHQEAAYARMEECRKRLVARGVDGLRAMESLLTDPEVKVQSWVATSLMPFESQAAKETLERLATADLPMVSLDAKITLRQWPVNPPDGPGESSLD
jgi:hypothetical protein